MHDTAAFISPPGNPEGEKARQMQILLALGIGLLLGLWMGTQV